PPHRLGLVHRAPARVGLVHRARGGALRVDPRAIGVEPLDPHRAPHRDEPVVGVLRSQRDPARPDWRDPRAGPVRHARHRHRAPPHPGSNYRPPPPLSTRAMLTPDDGSAMTWATLLGGWFQFAQRAVALPADAQGQRWKDSVAPAIGL